MDLSNKAGGKDSVLRLESKIVRSVDGKIGLGCWMIGTKLESKSVFQKSSLSNSIIRQQTILPHSAVPKFKD